MSGVICIVKLCIAIAFISVGMFLLGPLGYEFIVYLDDHPTAYGMTSLLYLPTVLLRTRSLSLLS